MYVAAEAYEAVTGDELPYDDAAMEPSPPAGERWNEDEVDQKYPALAAKFGGR